MATTTTTIEKSVLSNGKKNPKYIDLLDEDPTIAGQKFVCVSFLSPENVLKRREMFLFEQFVKQWDLSKSTEKFSDFLNFISYKYALNVDNVMNDLNEFVKEEETKLKESSTAIEDDFKTFMDKNEDRLSLNFNRANDFQTSVRGLKIRGVFGTQEESEKNCKKLRERDPNHDIFVAPCGVWLPWDPNAYKTGRVDHLEPELNKLYEEKMKNEVMAKQEFDERVKAAKRKAIEENIALARKSGNKLTQTLDENGNLVGANTMNFDDRTVADPKEREEVAKQVFMNSVEKP
jgi:hypothetical protein